MAVPYYDGRTRQLESTYNTSQYWLSGGKRSRAYTMKLSRTREYQYVDSFRGLFNGYLDGVRLKLPTRGVGLVRWRQLNPHPAIMRKYSLDSSGGEAVCRIDRNTVGVLTNGLAWGVLGQHLPSTGFTDFVNYDPLPISEAYSKAYEKQNPMLLDFGTNLGEIHETIEMFRSPLRGVSTFLTEMFSQAKRARRGRRSLAGFYEALTSTWLEYRYGIMPLVYTTVDAMSIAEKTVWDGFKVTKGGHTPIVKEGPVTVYGATVGDFYVNFNHQRVWKNSATVIVTGMPRYSVTLQDVIGLNVTNIPFIAIELATLSFVLEWFVDVSGWLRQLIPFENRYIHSVQLCEKREVVDTYRERFTYCIYGPMNEQVCSGATVTRSQHNLVRTLQPQIQAELRLGSGLSNLKRQLDAVALGSKSVFETAAKLLPNVKARKI